MISSTVVTITTDKCSKQLVENSTQLSLLIALVFMLKEELLCNEALIFYTDRQESLNKMMKSIFNFMLYEIRLDYCHMKKKCYDYMTIAIKGGKKNFANKKAL